MTDYGFLFDSTLCTACGACTTACRQWNGLEVREQGNRNELDADTLILSVAHFNADEPENAVSVAHLRCNHCQDAPCMDACPERVISFHNGWVVIDTEGCIGCGNCTAACPYSAVHVSSSEKGRPVARKCDGCIAVDTLEPPCSSVCPTGALIFGYRVTLIEEGMRRVKKMRRKYPRAFLVGDRQNDGWRVFRIARNDDEKAEYLGNVDQAHLIYRHRERALYRIARPFLPPSSALKKGMLDFLKGLLS